MLAEDKGPKGGREREAQSTVSQCSVAVSCQLKSTLSQQASTKPCKKEKFVSIWYPLKNWVFDANVTYLFWEGNSAKSSLNQDLLCILNDTMPSTLGLADSWENKNAHTHAMGMSPNTSALLHCTTCQPLKPTLFLSKVVDARMTRLMAKKKTKAQPNDSMLRVRNSSLRGPHTRNGKLT